MREKNTNTLDWFMALAVFPVISGSGRYRFSLANETGVSPIRRDSCHAARGRAKLQPQVVILAEQWTLKLAARESSGDLSHCKA